MFTKTIGMRCTTDGCPEKGKMVGPRATTCKACVKPMQQVTQANLPAIIGVAVVALGLLGGGGYYAYKHLIPTDGGGERPTDMARVAYAVQLDQGGFKTVASNYSFRGGDQFRVLVKPGFKANVYLFHEDSATGKMDMLPVGTQPLDANMESSIPPRGTIHMDSQPAPEKFTLVASAKPLPELGFDPKTDLSREQFQSIVDRIFSGVATNASNDGGWNVVESKDKANPLLRATFTLHHD